MPYSTYDNQIHDDLKSHKKSILPDAHLKANLVIQKTNAKMLFDNFFDLYVKDEFKNAMAVVACENQMILSMFKEGVYLNQKINDNPIFGYSFPEKNYAPFVKVLKEFNILNFDENSRHDKYYSYLIITICLKKISEEFFGNSFKDLYAGFFPDIQNLTLIESIKIYFSIDILHHLEVSSLSQFFYFIVSRNNELKQHANDYQTTMSILQDTIDAYLNKKEDDEYRDSLLNHSSSKNMNSKNLDNTYYTNLTLEKIDSLSGLDFEYYIGHLFKTLGYQVEMTPSTGDQGIDLIVIKNHLRIGIQTKRLSTKVNNSAIQEVVGGLNHYQLQKGMVITNNYFTNSAIELSKSNDIILWDRDKLSDVMTTVRRLNEIF